MSTINDWNRWGAENPYYGVITNPDFIGTELDRKSKKSFYDSGISDINNTFTRIQTLRTSKFKNAIDFGCGAGRLTIPLAKFCTKVHGIDVSSSIIKEAKKNTPDKLKSKIDYILFDGLNLDLRLNYDLVHSYIVLQHIPKKQGLKYIDQLIAGLDSDGIAALHFTHSYDALWIKKTIVWIRNHSLAAHYLFNIITKKTWNRPRMKMYLYNYKKILKIYSSYGINETVQINTNHGGYRGVMVIGKKP